MLSSAPWTGPSPRPPDLSSRAGSAIMIQVGDNPGLPKHRAGFAMLICAGDLLRAETSRRNYLAVFTTVLISHARSDAHSENGILHCGCLSTYSTVVPQVLGDIGDCKHLQPLMQS